MSLSPLDGRYRDQVASLRDIFSEESLVKKRVEIEIEYLLALIGVLPLKVKPLKMSQLEKLKQIIERFGSKDFNRVKRIEKQTRHDVKAVEYYVQRRLRHLGLGRLGRWVHWGLTSEDINNLAQTLQLRDGAQVLLTQGQSLQETLLQLIKAGKDTVMLARTHGQPALPTTMGKELLVYGLQLQELFEEMRDFEYRGKLTGAVGTLAAHTFAFPSVDWLEFGQRLVKSLGFKPERVTTQILPTISWARLFNQLEQLSLMVASLVENLWWYVALGYFKQRVNNNEVGSSTMAQKVNPIFLENAEGNAQLSAALFIFFVNKLSHSRLQRDLSDSTVRRNFGVAYGHLLLALKCLEEGLMRLALNKDRMRRELAEHPEVLAEAVQIMLRREGVETGYEKVKDFFRGDEHEELRQWLDKQKISQDTKVRLANLKPSGYIGVAVKLVEREITKLEKRIRKLARS